MQSEELLEQHLPTVENVPSKRSRKTRILIWVHALTFLLGLALLVYLVYRLGYQSLFDSVSKVGWGFLFIFALNLGRHLLRAASLYIAVDPKQRNFKYSAAAMARLGGEAVTFFTFTGPFLGDATKAVLLKRELPLKYGASALIIDNIVYYSSVIAMILAGVAVLIYMYGSNSPTMTNVLAGIVVFSVLMFVAIVAVVWFELRPVSRITRELSRRNLLPAFIAKKQESLVHIESNVFDFYNSRRLDFFLICAVTLLVHGLSITEVWLCLRFLDINGSMPQAFIIESLTKVINAVFGFIPGTIGVYEGGNGVILKVLGYTTAVGVALALIRRGAILLSTVIGMVILLWRAAARGARHFAKPD